MPYIKQENRKNWENGLNTLCTSMETFGVTPGDLNYLFTKLSHFYLDRKGLSYTHLNDIVGALENSKLELYRRKAVPYENDKTRENGDLE